MHAPVRSSWHCVRYFPILSPIRDSEAARRSRCWLTLDPRFLTPTRFSSFFLQVLAPDRVPRSGSATPFSGTTNERWTTSHPASGPVHLIRPGNTNQEMPCHNRIKASQPQHETACQPKWHMSLSIMLLAIYRLASHLVDRCHRNIDESPMQHHMSILHR